MSRVVSTEVVHYKQDVLQSLSSLTDDCRMCGKQWKPGHTVFFWGGGGRGKSHAAIQLDATEQEPEQELMKGRI